MPKLAAIPRPKRWDVPFSDTISDSDVDRLMSLAPFNGLDPDNFKGSVTLRGILKNDARMVRCKEGDIIVREGDWGNSAFFIVFGTARVELESADNALPASILGRRETQRKNFFQALAQLWKNHREREVRDVSSYVLDSRIATRGSGESTRIYLQDVPAVLDKYRTAKIEAGQFFGELAALGRIPRTATVFAEDDCVLLEIRWQGIRDIMRRDEGLRAQIDARFRERGLSVFLRNEPMFSHLTDSEMDQLVAQAELESFGRYDSAGSLKKVVQAGTASDLKHEAIIAREGHYPNGMIVVRSGVARVSKRYHNGHQTVGYLTPGQVFGFNEIAESWRSNEQSQLRHSLRAIGYVTVIVIPTPLVERFVLKQVFGEGKAKRTTAAAASAAGVSPEDAGLKIDSDLFEFLVERGFVNGTATMMIDLDRCTRCDDCVRACAATHDGNPRFLRHGPTHDHFMVANSCMHCEDPVCMIECPTGAIHRDMLEGWVVINDQTCIGCSACAKNCPYDAIRMVEIRGPNGNFLRDVSTNLPISKATKCDLCIDQPGGPSCQRACPHDALSRIDMRNVGSLADWLNR